MSLAISLHNDWLLWFIQEGVYAHPILAAVALGLLLFGLSAHRPVVWWTIIVPVNLFCWLCLLIYGAPTAAPGLAAVMSGMLAWQVLRAILWRGMADKAFSRLPRWCAFPLWPARRLARSYILIDPRATYWIDLARAERGLALVRNRDDRRSAVLAHQAPGWRWQLWRLWFRLVEVRIGIWRRLPRFYHLDQTTLDLAEPHLIEALREACSRESHRLISLWTADSLEAYCDRSERDHAAAMLQAADCGRRWMQHREALAEIMTAGPRNAGDGDLVRAARYVYSTGQLRRQYDHLWHEKLDFARLSSEHFEPEPSGLAANGAATGAVNGSGHAPSQANGHANGSGPADDSANGNAPREAVLEAIRERFGAPPATNGSEHADDEDSDQPDEPDEPVSDDLLFGVEEGRAAEGPVDPDGHDISLADAQLSRRDRERAGDLQLGKQLLGAFLAIDVSQSGFKATRLDEAFKQPESRAAVLLLVAFLCLEEKYRPERRASAHGDLLQHWAIKIEQVEKRVQQQRQMGKSAKAKAGSDDVMLLREFHQHYRLDVLYERQAFLRIRELLGSDLQLLPHQARLLADAERELAQRLAGQPQFQTMLRLDAIDHYFQARFPGLWTIEVAQHLVEGIRDRQDLQVRFGKNKMELKGGGRMEVDEAGAPAKTRRSAKLSNEVLKQALQAEPQTRIEVEIQNRGNQVWKIPFFIGGDKDCHWRLEGAPRVELRELNDQLWVLASRATPDVLVVCHETGRSLNPTQARFKPGDILRIGRSISIRLTRVEKS